VFTPNDSWEEPTPLEYKQSAVIQGHAAFGAEEHPNKIEDLSGAEYGFYGSLVVIMIVIGLVSFRKMKKMKNKKQKDDE
jgi:hypothetical protein